MKVGIAGTGRMASAIGARLLQFGHTLTVWNRTRDKTAALAAAGARVVPTAAEVASASEIILTIVTDAQAIDAIYRGAEGLLSGEVSGKLFVEMSTVRPAVSQALAQKVGAKGGALVDCPVGGTVGPASEGKLFAVAGGAARDVERVRLLFKPLCRRFEHVGGVGAGARLKLAMNIGTQVFWQSFGEALALCEPLELDPERLMDIFVDTSGASRVMHHRAPDIAATLRGEAIEPVNFDVDSVRKDMRAMVEEARALGTTLPVVERALECFDDAARRGHGAEDCATLPAIWAKRR